MPDVDSQDPRQRATLVTTRRSLARAGAPSPTALARAQIAVCSVDATNTDERDYQIARRISRANIAAIFGPLFLDRWSQLRTMHSLCRSEEAAMEVAVERHGKQNRQGEKESAP